MPVRKIPISRRTITGHQILRRHRRRMPFESLLERDFLVLADFDWNVASIEGQPVSVPWTDKQGRRHPYTPDFLVKFVAKEAQVPAAQPGKARPWLVEVKDSETLRKEWVKFRPRFRAATRYARERGWTFRLFTERIIRTPYLYNANRLLPVLDWARDDGLCDTILIALSRQGTSTAVQLVSSLTSNTSVQHSLFRAVWRLIADGQIGVSLDVPLSVQTPLWRVSEPTLLPSVIS